MSIKRLSYYKAAIHNITILKVSIIALSLYFFCTFILIAIMRMGYPFELQWMEGSILENVSRVIHNKPIYAAPSMEFVSYLYMPLYYYISALFCKVFGLGFFTIRLVSFISSIGCVLVIFSFVLSETRNKFAAVAGIGLFAASYNLCSGYYDIGRIDMLFVFFLLLGMFLMKYINSLLCTVAASLSFASAFFTKQTALIVVFVLCLYLFVFKVKYRVWFAAVFITVAVTGCLLLNNIYNGWFYYYVFGVSSKHNIGLIGFLAFLAVPLVYFYPTLSLHVLLKSNVRKVCFYAAMLAATGLLTLAAMVNILAGTNVLVPMTAALSILFGLGVNSFFNHNHNHNHDHVHNHNQSSDFIKLMKPYWFEKGKVAYILLIAQFLVLLYNPLKFIPSKKDVDAGQYLVKKIQAMQGKVFIPYHPYLVNDLSKVKYSHIMPLYDILELQRESLQTDNERRIRQVFLDAISRQEFDYIILDDINKFGLLQVEIEKYYQLGEKIFDDSGVFWTFSGEKRRPESIYVRKTEYTTDDLSNKQLQP